MQLTSEAAGSAPLLSDRGDDTWPPAAAPCPSLPPAVHGDNEHAPSTSTTAMTSFKYPAGFPAPPVGYGWLFQAWARWWWRAHPGEPVSGDLERLLDRFAEGLALPTGGRAATTREAYAELSSRVKDLKSSLDNAEDCQARASACYKRALSTLMSIEESSDDYQLAEERFARAERSLDKARMAVQQEREEFNKAQRSRNDAQSKFDKVSMAYMDEVERMRVAQEIALKLGPLAGDTTQMDKPWSSLGHIYSQPKAMPSRHLRNSGLTLQVSFDDDFQLVEREYQKMLRNLAGIRDMDVPRAEPIINGEYLEPWLIGKEQGITPLFEKVVVPRIKGMLAIIQPEAKFTPIPGNPNDQADYFLQVSVATKDTNGKVTRRVSSIAIEFKLPQEASC